MGLILRIDVDVCLSFLCVHGAPLHFASSPFVLIKFEPTVSHPLERGAPRDEDQRDRIECIHYLGGTCTVSGPSTRSNRHSCMYRATSVVMHNRTTRHTSGYGNTNAPM